MSRTPWLIMATTAVAFGVAMGLAGAQPQPAPPADAAGLNIEADPIRCWWRTSTSAVRVGEPFRLVLTCAIVDNESTTVVPDQSRLEPRSEEHTSELQSQR